MAVSKEIVDGCVASTTGKKKGGGGGSEIDYSTALAAEVGKGGGKDNKREERKTDKWLCIPEDDREMVTERSKCSQYSLFILTNCELILTFNWCRLMYLDQT